MTIVRAFQFTEAFSPDQTNDLERMLQFVLEQLQAMTQGSVTNEGDTTIINNIEQDEGPIEGRTIGLNEPEAGRFSQLLLPIVYSEDLVVASGTALCIPDNSEINCEIEVNGQLNII